MLIKIIDFVYNIVFNLFHSILFRFILYLFILQNNKILHNLFYKII